MARTNFRLYHSSMSPLDVSKMLNCLKNDLGFLYGYHPIEMNDTMIKSFIGTLNKKKRISEIAALSIAVYLRGYLTGSGHILYRIEWD
jgi:hypothetical protein